MFFLPASTTSSDPRPNSHIFSQTLVHLIYGQCGARTRGLSTWALSSNSCVTWARTVASPRPLASIPHPEHEMRLEQMTLQVLPRPAPWSIFSIDSAVDLQSLSRVQLSATPWTAAHQASLSFTISQSLLKLMSIESVMPSNHLALCRLLLLLPSIFPSIRVFSNEPVLIIRWPKY